LLERRAKAKPSIGEQLPAAAAQRQLPLLVSLGHAQKLHLVPRLPEAAPTAEPSVAPRHGDTGDGFLMDSTPWHHGGANSSEHRRRLFYVTFAVPHCNPVGSTYSILDEMVGQLRLRQFL